METNDTTIKAYRQEAQNLRDELERERMKTKRLREELSRERIRSDGLDRQIRGVDESLSDPTQQKGKGYIHTFGVVPRDFMDEIEGVERRLGMSPTMDEQMRSLGYEDPQKQLAAADTKGIDAILDASEHLLQEIPSRATRVMVAKAFQFVDYMAERIAEDPNIRYYCGRDTEAFRLLTHAMAARAAVLMPDEPVSAEDVAKSLLASACTKPAEIEDAMRLLKELEVGYPAEARRNAEDA